MKSSILRLVPPHNLLLTGNAIHVWCGFLDLHKRLIQQFENLLSEDELIRADQFHFSIDKERFVIARGMLRTILSFYLGVAPNDIQFQYSQYGKPFLHSDINFNVSHSNSIAVVGITKYCQIGIDVEYTKYLPDADKIAQRFFSSQENLIYQELPQELKQTAFYHCWTRKEAFIKAIGEGLSYPLDQFGVSFLSNEEPCIRHINGDKNQGKKWSLKALRPHPDYIGAIAVEGKNLRFVEYKFQYLFERLSK